MIIVSERESGKEKFFVKIHTQSSLKSAEGKFTLQFFFDMISIAYNSIVLFSETEHFAQKPSYCCELELIKSFEFEFN